MSADRKGQEREGADREGADREGADREGADREGADREGADRGGAVTAGAKLSVVVGIVAAMVLGLVANLLVARKYQRWDVTKGGLYTLSEPTLQTLRSLEEPVQIYVLLPPGAPLTTSVGHLLEAYEAESSRLVVKETDPDRYAAEYIAIQNRFGGGASVADAAIIVARGEKPYFLTEDDLIAVDDAEDVRVRPKLEEALTTAIRAVTSGKKPLVCFATGHGEKSLEVGGGGGLAALSFKLHKNNYETKEIAPARAGEKEELPSCDLLVIAGPTEPVAAEDIARYVGFVKAGGSALVAVSPVPDADDAKYVDLKMGELFAALGLGLDANFVFEVDPKRRDANGFGETFEPEPKMHPITEQLVKVADKGIGVTMTVASSLTKVPGSAPALTPLLVTSDKAFGMVDFFKWAKNPTPPEAQEGDHKGPLTVGWAVEMPKPSGSDRGGRAVVFGSSGVLLSTNWQNEDLRGTAVLVENSISWLVSRPALVSVPKKPAVSAGVRVSADDLTRLGLYTVLCMPLATMLFGVAVYLRRRGGERRGKRDEGEAGERAKGAKSKERRERDTSAKDADAGEPSAGGAAGKAKRTSKPKSKAKAGGGGEAES